MILTIRTDLISATTQSLSRYFSIVFPCTQDIPSESSQFHLHFETTTRHPLQTATRHWSAETSPEYF